MSRQTFWSLTLLVGVLLYGATSNKVAAQSYPATPDYATNILLNDSLSSNLSTEAKRILGRPFTPIPSYYTHRDTLFMPSLFMPLLFDEAKMSALQLPVDEVRKEYWVRAPRYFKHETAIEKSLQEDLDEMSQRTPFTNFFERWEFSQEVREELFRHSPSLVSRSTASLPQDRIKTEIIYGQGYSGELDRTDMSIAWHGGDPGLERQTVERKYWRHNFLGTAHLSQNQISKNWHKGGFSSLNFNSRINYGITYERGRVKWVNNLEYRLGLFTNQELIKAQQPTEESKEVQKLKISEDMFRINSNLGISAFRDWFYTLDYQLRSQLLRNVNADGRVITMPFAPIVMDAGIGMKYEVDRKQFRGDPFQRFRFSLNVAPVSATFIYVYNDEVDKGRVGLTADEKHKFRLGSSVRMGLTWDFSDLLSWSSRVFYNTSYRHVETEFDNTIRYSFNKYFSTMLSLSLRFDDSVILNEPKTFKNLIQYNQLFSFGFEYKF